MKRDAYTELFKMIDKKVFFEKSLNDIIYIDFEKIDEQWLKLKHDISNKKEVYIRGYGRDAKKSDFFLEFFKILFNNPNFKKDSTNNAQPTKLIATLTNYSKVKSGNYKDKNLIVNYQISHLFGKTKNPFLFNCAWNIAYVPKYLDPFTGHETQGEYSKEFKELFTSVISEKFKNYIADYNKLILEHQPKIKETLKATQVKLNISNVDFKKFEKDCLKEFAIIEM